jgi:hypothetical protein
VRSYQVFAAMSPERAVAVMRLLAEKAPAIFAEALQAASLALKARPVYLQRQPFEKRCEAIRRALARVPANGFAGELLATYFLECRGELLREWLDVAGVEHEDGTLSSDAPPAPPEKELTRAVARFREKGDDPDRELLLNAFAAQDAIEWPVLEGLLGAIP